MPSYDTKTKRVPVQSNNHADDTEKNAPLESTYHTNDTGTEVHHWNPQSIQTTQKQKGSLYNPITTQTTQKKCTTGIHIPHKRYGHRSASLESAKAYKRHKTKRVPVQSNNHADDTEKMHHWNPHTTQTTRVQKCITGIHKAYKRHKNKKGPCTIQ